MTVLIFIAVLLLLIIGHELGHFLAAKWSKMKVLEFGVGFPPKIFGKKFSKDGTEYTLNWIPFGGFVRIFGEDEKDLHDPQAFPNRPVLHQAFVLFAGPFANIILAILLSTLALTVGTIAIIDSENNVRADNQRVVVTDVLLLSPAQKAGIMVGDTITSSPTPELFSEMIAESEGSVDITIVRSGEERIISLTPEVGVFTDDPERKVVGVATALVGTVSYPLHIAFVRAVVETAHDFVFILVSLTGLIASAFTLSVDVSQIAGPVGIAALTGDAAAFGFGALLSFAALLSINLAIINLLPFPALDGGRLLFLGIETVTRKKIPLNVAVLVNTAGFVILILLMLAITIGDISRLIR